MAAERRGPKKPLDHDPAAVTAAREMRGMTRAAVAQRLRVSPSLITEIEQGTRNATPRILPRLARVLGVPAGQIRRQPPGVIAVYQCARCGRRWEPGHACEAAEAPEPEGAAAA